MESPTQPSLQTDSQTCTIISDLSTLYSSPSKPIKARPTLPLTSPTRLTSPQNDKEETILYLAYGSNLSHETFVGNRGIHPLSSINVSVPSLSLTFDLAGLPYIEPCFANTAYRTIPPTQSRDHTHIENSTERTSREKGWEKGLIGVVYEVTPEDYRTIIATEGGGASYQDILVPCFPLPSPNTSTPSTLLPPNQFPAHTLLSPSSTGHTRPNPGYAQPSARYLKLITDGAEEHALPAEYIAYLYRLQPYTITTYRQRVGQVLFLGFWAPVLALMLAVTRMAADKEGRIPAWLVRITGMIFASVWGSYDVGFKRVFGDGERTIDKSEGDEERGFCGRGTGRGWRWCEKGVRL